MKRRDFIYTTGLTTSAVMLGGMQLAKGAPIFNQFANLAKAEDRKLILIFLNGGNDGLNTVIPLDQYGNLFNARQNILVPENLILKLRDDVGLNPALSGLKELYEDGKLHVLQSVGYPQPNFSHFRSTDIWTSASDSDKVISSGWLGRELYTKHPNYPTNYPNQDNLDPLSITYGPYVSPTCQGPTLGMGMAITPNSDGEIDIYNIKSGGIDTAPATPAGNEIEYIRQIINQTQLYGDTLEGTFEKGKNLMSDKWDKAGNNNRLIGQLQVTAKLIAGGSKTRIFVHSLGGFDTHANQVQQEGDVEGNHFELLKMISESVSAFQDEMKLQNLEDNVVGMTFSEFGRRILSNASNGTDHGSAAPLFVFGSRVIPGVQGDNPNIPSTVTVQDNLPMQFDFRSVYYSLLKDWFEVEDTDLENIMLGKHQHLDIIQKSQSSVTNDYTPKDFDVFPNPMNGSGNLKFKAEAGMTFISIYNNRGQEVKKVFEGQTISANKELSFETNGLNSGNYHIRVQTGNKQIVRPVQIVK
ncbi:MAG: hypothetical protein CVV25_11160 [Ignavibacteriae bacterium HGW-Ignavibacteriae-4]|jgi:uncharacterized protein (DUF1501 family)|nr:MAG: hypothetical protein CVV25_11160 [Ignavibacteriae bacterium HGW-Ignavibacteriae-4]